MTLERVDPLGAVPKLGLVGVRLDVIALTGVVFIRWFVITRVFLLLWTRGVFPLFSLARIGHIVVEVTIRSTGVQFR